LRVEEASWADTGTPTAIARMTGSKALMRKQTEESII
jgi:hypothetical protein